MESVTLSNPNPEVRRFKRLEPVDVQCFERLLGAEWVRTDSQTLEDFSHDWTEDLRFPPEVVLMPGNTEEVSGILAYCNTHRIPVTPVGARTGLSGGMLPVHGGVALSMARFNRIVDLDTRNLQITVEPGVITQHIQEAAEAVGLMYPPDPSSKGSCFIGGNIAENSGGAHAVKYGITRDYVLALQAVLPSGEVIETGARVLKNSTGYNLTQLLVGSEGTLAVITRITLKLLPKPRLAYTLLAPFADPQAACDAVSAIFRAGLTPAALEFMEKDAIVFGQAFLGINTYATEGVGAHLLIEVDGNSAEQVMADCEAITAVLETYGVQEIYFADDAEKQKELWRLRRCIGEAVKGNTIYKEEDTVVPRAELARLLTFVKELSAEYGFQSVCYGHAGDGNLHVNIIKNDLSDTAWNQTLPLAIRRLFEFVVSLGGTLSGEHGIGHVQRQYMDIAFSPVELQLMRSIKQVFDPNGILNPDKIL
jgi:glycolate oxidase